MTRILLEDAHAQAGSGAPGEREWSRALNDRIVPLLAARGIETVRVGGTTVDQPIYHEDFLCFLTNHYDADVYVSPPGTNQHQGGAFWGRAARSTTAAKDDDLGERIWAKYAAFASIETDHFERRNANTSDYYAFRFTSATTPGVIFEWGVGAPVCNGHGQPSAPDHDFLRAKINEIAVVVAEGVLAYHLAQGGTAPVAQSPARAGQSADLRLVTGQVATITGIWQYGGRPRSITRKVYALSAGRRIYTMYPQVDPDADATEDLSAEPCIFVVDVTP